MPRQGIMDQECRLPMPFLPYFFSNEVYLWSIRMDGATLEIAANKSTMSCQDFYTQGKTEVVWLNVKKPRIHDGRSFIIEERHETFA